MADASIERLGEKIHAALDAAQESDLTLEAAAALDELLFIVYAATDLQRQIDAQAQRISRRRRELMPVRAVFGVNLAVDSPAEVDIARIEAAMHWGLQEQGIPVVDVEFDGFESVGAPVPQVGLGPFDQPGAPSPPAPPPGLPGPLGPPYGPGGRPIV